MNGSTTLAQRLAAVRRRIAAACERAGREPDEVLLVGVSKRQPPERVAEALAEGVLDLGESYAQHLPGRQELFPRARWHFIGHLQRNKVRLVVPACTLIHSVDSLRLAAAIVRHAEAAGLQQAVLLEAGTGEASKTGASPEDLPALATFVEGESALRLEGLMGMAPWGSAEPAARRAFRDISGLRRQLQQHLGRTLPHLSMGMSGDLEVAVEEGATMVRVGEALFGPRG